VSASAVLQTTLRHARARAGSSLARSYIGAAAWSVVASASSRVAMLITWILCARMLLREDFGSVTLIYSTLTLLGDLGALGLGATASRFVGELRISDPAKAGRIIGMSSVLSLISGAAMAGFVAAFAEWISVHVLGRASLTTSLQIGAVVVLFGALNAHQTGALAGLHCFRHIAQLNICTSLFSAVAMSVGLRWGGAQGAIYALAAWRVVTWAAYHVTLRSQCQKHGIAIDRLGWTAEKSVLWRFSIPAVLASLMFAPAIWAGAIILARVPEGYSQVAIYNAADRWHTAVLFVPSAMLNMVMPMLTGMIGRRDQRGFRNVVYLNITTCLLMAGVPALLFIAGAPYLMRSFGSGYVEGAAVLRLLCVAAIAEVINWCVGQTVVVRSMWARFLLDALLSGTLLGCCYVAVPRWGAVGLAASYAAAFIVTATAVCVYAARTGCFATPKWSRS
jgi:O-antigen/teichoic acid export membrane protein